jgi:NADH-quinone oxidoreductase subunit C
MALEEFDPKEEKGETWIDATREDATRAVLALKQEGARLITISGVDDQTDMKVYYHFDLGGKIVNLTVSLPKGEPVIPSIVKTYPNADLYERELSEMFNILITGHPDLKPLFLSKELQGKAPLRKEFKGLKE